VGKSGREPLEGKTILLYVEQGFGDEILSLRFASVIKAAQKSLISGAIKTCELGERAAKYP
jgi:hypothetical protein